MSTDIETPYVYYQIDIRIKKLILNLKIEKDKGDLYEKIKQI